MNNLRREIVKKAFRSISGQAPKVEKEVLRQAIDTSRHPAVLRGDLRAEEALSQIFDSLPNPVAEKDFLEVYERISDSVQDDSEFYTTVTRTWAMEGSAQSAPEAAEDQHREVPRPS
jgi:RNA binding exosome subunit